MSEAKARSQSERRVPAAADDDDDGDDKNHWSRIPSCLRMQLSFPAALLPKSRRGDRRDMICPNCDSVYSSAWGCCTPTFCSVGSRASLAEAFKSIREKRNEKQKEKSLEWPIQLHFPASTPSNVGISPSHVDTTCLAPVINERVGARTLSSVLLPGYSDWSAGRVSVVALLRDATMKFIPSIIFSKWLLSYASLSTDSPSAIFTQANSQLRKRLTRCSMAKTDSS
ncbi:hypothetical protein F5Y12DRAFT_789896 [Xylaria sp. FL1777]|nr:hypothetical protein F5Y12DRAFT_789896 [Xylaria sp. FL1777]